jgi:uncharacterized protein DUF547
MCAVLGVLALTTGARSQATLHVPFDRILDTYVRDGYVYYQALQKERAGLDRYIASLDMPRATVDRWPQAEQKAFWVNAYNALVLQTVINNYPIKVRSPDYPAKSIRQIPGSFEQLKHRVAGASFTLDEIEKDVIIKFGDARLLLALARGAIGSGRLRSEVYQGAELERQLTEVMKECASRVVCVKVDRARDTLEVSPLFGWRQEAFIASFAASTPMWSDRAPIERAVAAMIYPHLFPSERESLALGTFRMTYGTFDWRLNDLTGGIPE